MDRARLAVVTGGGRGIGRAIVLRLAGDGMDVLFTYRRDHDAATEVVEASGELPGTVRHACSDVADLGSVGVVFERVAAEWGGLDVLVNDAGVAEQATFAEATEAHYAVYSASKAAIEQYTKVAALELGARGIAVNAVCRARPTRTYSGRRTRPRRCR